MRLLKLFYSFIAITTLSIITTTTIYANEKVADKLRGKTLVLTVISSDTTKYIVFSKITNSLEDRIDFSKGWKANTFTKFYTGNASHGQMYASYPTYHHELATIIITDSDFVYIYFTDDRIASYITLILSLSDFHKLEDGIILDHNSQESSYQYTPSSIIQSFFPRTASSLKVQLLDIQPNQDNNINLMGLTSWEKAVRQLSEQL